MKNKILVISDNYYNYFTAKSLLTSQMKLNVDTVSATTEAELMSSAQELKPSYVICRVVGGAVELLSMLKSRGVNCRNATITMLVTPEMDHAAMTRLTQRFGELKLKTIRAQSLASAA